MQKYQHLVEVDTCTKVHNSCVKIYHDVVEILTFLLFIAFVIIHTFTISVKEKYINYLTMAIFVIASIFTGYMYLKFVVLTCKKVRDYIQLRNYLNETDLDVYDYMIQQI